MKRVFLLRAAVALGVFSAALPGADSRSLTGFVVTNDDTASTTPSTVTFYSVGADGTLAAGVPVSTGGQGIGGGFFAAGRVIVLTSGKDVCVFASNAGSGSITGVNARTQQVTGTFAGSSSDSGLSNGMALAGNADYVYATYSDQSHIATFQLETGCMLSFVSDLFTAGLNGGVVDGMAIHGDMMVVTYGDGSIQSFNISEGAPVSNGDQQNSTGANDDHRPNGIDITSDGHYAIFGDASTVTTVEVSDISSGKLAPTVVYYLAPAWNSGNVRLSPDETMLYVTNDSSGRVTAAFFNAATGAVSPGCTSPILANFYKKFSYAGGVRTQLTTGTGGLLYVPEFGLGGASYVGILQLTVTGTACTLTEASNSPVADPDRNSSLLSIEVYPTRTF